MTKKIRVHDHAHLDEGFAIAGIRHWFAKEAEKMWPGSSTAAIEPFTTGVLLGGKTERDFPNELFIGCAKARETDEHDAEEAKKDRCAASLVFEKLGVLYRPEVKWLTELVCEEDRNGTKRRDHIAAVIKLIHHTREPLSTDALVEWVKDACGAEMYAHLKGWRVEGIPLTLGRIHKLLKRRGSRDADRWMDIAVQATLEKQERQAKAREVMNDLRPEEFETSKTESGRGKLLVVKDLNDQAAGVAWSHSIDVFVHVRKSGHMQIMTRNGSGLCLRRTAALLRAEEISRRNLPPVKDPKLLLAVDILACVPQWHLVNTKGEHKTMLLNGSYTAPKVQVSKTPIDYKIELVKLGLS